jgi:predicted transcriptional regulator
MLGVKEKGLLVVEFAFLFGFATLIMAFMSLHSYTFHFEQVTLNYYTNGKVDFTTDVTGLVKSLATVAMLSLVFGTATGGAVGLTYSANLKTADSTTRRREYDAELAQKGLVVINRTGEGVTYQLTDLGRRFLREYRFLDKLEENLV